MRKNNCLSTVDLHSVSIALGKAFSILYRRKDLTDKERAAMFDVFTNYCDVRRRIGKGKDGKRYNSREAYDAMRG